MRCCCNACRWSVNAYYGNTPRLVLQYGFSFLLNNDNVSYVL
jgi:hypothetical protein